MTRITGRCPRRAERSVRGRRNVARASQPPASTGLRHRVEAGRHPHIHQNLRILRMARGEFGKPGAGLLHHRKHLQRAHQPITGRGFVGERMWPEVSPPRVPPVSFSSERTWRSPTWARRNSMPCSTRVLSPDAHHVAHHRPLATGRGLMSRHGKYEEHLIAVHAAPSSSTITTRSPSPSSAKPNCARTPGTVNCSSSGAVGPGAALMLRPFGEQPIGTISAAKIGEHSRRHLVACAIGAIDDDLEALEASRRQACSRRRNADTGSDCGRCGWPCPDAADSCVITGSSSRPSISCSTPVRQFAAGRGQRT